MVLQQILSDSILTDPPSPNDNMNAFSFYTREPTNVNPFQAPAQPGGNAYFHSASQFQVGGVGVSHPFTPLSVSTPRKSHHVSMPTLPARPLLPKPLNYSLDNKKPRMLPSTPSLLPRAPSFRPFVIRVQSSNNLEEANDTLSMRKPSQARRLASGQPVKRTPAGRLTKSKKLWLRICAGTLKRKFSCSPDTSECENGTTSKQRGYYFI